MFLTKDEEKMCDGEFGETVRKSTGSAGRGSGAGARGSREGGHQTTNPIVTD